MAAPSKGRDWQRLIRSAVREACETWRIQTQAGPVTADALDAIIHRAAVPVLSRLQDEPPEVVVALVPNLVRVMLVSAVEVMAEERGQRLARPSASNGSASPGEEAPGEASTGSGWTRCSSASVARSIGRLARRSPARVAAV